MTHPERFPPDDPREWLNRARSDLVQAKRYTPDVYPEDFCFHAQQAAEKAIKGLLIMRQVEFPYTHDLAHLLTLPESAGELIPQAVGRARRLTAYAFTTRYPNVAKPVTKQDIEAAVEIAEAVVRWVEGRVSAGR